MFSVDWEPSNVYTTVTQMNRNILHKHLQALSLETHSGTKFKEQNHSRKIWKIPSAHNTNSWENLVLQAILIFTNFAVSLLLSTSWINNNFYTESEGSQMSSRKSQRSYPSLSFSLRFISFAKSALHHSDSLSRHSCYQSLENWG